MFHPGPVVAQVEAGNLPAPDTRDVGLALFVETDGHRTGDERVLRPNRNLQPTWIFFRGRGGLGQFLGNRNPFDPKGVQVYPFVFVVSPGDETDEKSGSFGGFVFGGSISFARAFALVDFVPFFSVHGSQNGKLIVPVAPGKPGLEGGKGGFLVELQLEPLVFALRMTTWSLRFRRWHGRGHSPIGKRKR